MHLAARDYQHFCGAVPTGAQLRGLELARFRRYPRLAIEHAEKSGECDVDAVDQQSSTLECGGLNAIIRRRFQKGEVLPSEEGITTSCLLAGAHHFDEATACDVEGAGVYRRKFVLVRYPARASRSVGVYSGPHSSTDQ